MHNQLIIFSKNRACQLHLLLESINKNSKGIFNNITVLYKADGKYIDGYNLLKERFGDYNIIFKEESNFRNDTIKLISDKFTYTTFLVDDTVFFDKCLINFTEIDNFISKNNLICFSLRLGLNSVYSHPANLHYEIGEYKSTNNFISFDFTKQRGDLAYPLSVDGHIFKTSEIKDMITRTIFKNPNTLEANLQQQIRIGLPSNLFGSFKHSKLVGIPVNLVNDTFNNRHGLEFYISELELNNRYLDGEIIDLLAMDFTNINGPHKEIKYEFKKG